jgi:biopolymer transport protein ExbD
MAKVKPKRQGVHFDLTAMSDVAWLLLTFFILTTQFKKPDIIEIKTPKSVAETKLQDGDLMRISISSDGRYLFSIVDDRNKIPVLEQMGQKYGINFTDAEKRTFLGMADVPVSIGALKQYLNLNKAQQEKNVTGIPLDSTDLQLIDWVTTTLNYDDRVKLAIRGDVKAQYPEFKELIKQLVEKDINKFQLITNSEAKPK